ncbi:TetR/AcrR family transcriptional regulator [candidate division WOR-3 bacterium]|nr:TetR/AcrR family transcriptional regulator [candidate division WOR-3 bacterium]
MTGQEKKDAKQRIYDAAISLFARKGYAAVGVREIAKTANVNISMICYYFGKKVDILKAIINECYDKYYQTILNIGDESTPTQERVRLIVRNLVEFFRANTELAMVALNTLPIDIPEIMELKIKWMSRKSKATIELYTQLGLDTNDVVKINVIRAVLTTIILEHFQFRYAWKHIMQTPNKSKYTREFIKQETIPEYNDAFYEKYSEILAELYFHGLNSIVAHNPASEEGNNTTK